MKNLNMTLLECLEESIIKSCGKDLKKLISMKSVMCHLESDYHLFNITNYEILIDSKGNEYYQYEFSNEQYEIETSHCISLVNFSLKDKIYNDLAILCDSETLMVKDYPIQNISIYRIDGVVERYHFDYNKEQNEEKKLLLERLAKIFKD